MTQLAQTAMYFEAGFRRAENSQCCLAGQRLDGEQGRIHAQYPAVWDMMTTALGNLHGGRIHTPPRFAAFSS